jgi:multiple sugar transport system substrate-binding protein
MSTLNRRSFLKTTGVVGAGLALGACGGGGTSSSGGAASTGKLSGTATLTTWGADAEIAAFKQIAADFQAARGATVEIEVLPYDQIRTVVDRRLQAQQPPDLFRVSYTDVGGYARTGALADLSDHLEDGFGDAFLPALWETVNVDGVPVGVPHHTDTSALAYNKAHFEKAGITDVPTSLDTAWTWEQFTEVLAQLDAAQLGAEPFAFNYQVFGAYRFFNTVYQAGGSVLDDDLEEVTLDTPEARRAFEFVHGLYDRGLHAPSILVKRPTYPSEVFPTGKLSMIQTGDFQIPSLESAIAGKFDWGVTYLMRDEQAATDLGGNAVVLTEGAKNRDVAAEFAKFLVTKENMARFCEQTTVLPVRQDLVEQELAYAVRPDLMPVFQQQATTMPEGLVRVSTSPAFPGINQALVDTMDQYLTDRSADTDGVVERLTGGIEKALQAQG